MSSPNVEDTLPTRPDSPEPSAPSDSQPVPEKTPENAPVKKLRKIYVIILGIVLIIVFAGVGGWIGLLSGRNATAQNQQNQQNQKAVDAATQFQLALQDQGDGKLDIAQKRLEYVISLDSNFPGATQKLAEVMMAIQASLVPTITPTPTLTPTPDTRGEQEMYAQIVQLINNSKWSDAIDTISAIRKKNLGYRTVDVDGMYYLALRGLGINKIGAGDLEGGIYMLTLAERFGPLDTLAAGYRTWARYYLNGASFWKIDWLKVINYFSEVVPATPNLRDGSGMTASERYRIALYQYAEQLMKDDPCKAKQYFDQSLKIGNDPTVVPIATQAANQCQPPTKTPSPSTKTATATKTAAGTITGVPTDTVAPTKEGATNTPVPPTTNPPTSTPTPPAPQATETPTPPPPPPATSTHTPAPTETKTP